MHLKLETNFNELRDRELHDKEVEIRREIAELFLNQPTSIDDLGEFEQNYLRL